MTSMIVTITIIIKYDGEIVLSRVRSPEDVIFLKPANTHIFLVFVDGGDNNRGGGRRGGGIVGVAALRRILPRRDLRATAAEFSPPVVRLDVV